MNISIENLAPCKQLIRVDVPEETVKQKMDVITGEFRRQANLPGFRAGKAPKHMVIKSYGDRIEQEVRKDLVNEGYRKAIKDNDLHTVGNPDVEEIQFGQDLPFQFAVTVETAPTFELPDYKGIKIQKEIRSVTDEDIDKAMGVLQDRQAKFENVDRSIEENDYAVIDYTGQCDGKPITETAPKAESLAKKDAFWIHVHAGHFIDGFPEQLVGLGVGDKKDITLKLAEDFVIKELASKDVTFSVEIKEIKTKQSPEIDDAFAKEFGAEDVAGLREGVANDLENELKTNHKRSTRDQLVKHLLTNVHCDLPESIVDQETKNVVYDLVRENQQRGIAKETIDEKKDEIYTAATSSAKERVKVAFIIGKIAAKEGVKVTNEEISQRVIQMAQSYNMPPEQLAKKLKERNGVAEIQEQILTSKVLDLLELQAEVEEVLPKVEEETEHKH
ncbi:trigger factor [bacterium]|nr:trigger factor [bacterium]